MRWIFFLLCLTGFSFSVRGQEQERKLADRLLRPDMSLANPAQDKKFTAAGGTSVDRKFVAKSFSSGEEKKAQSYAGNKSFLVRVFGVPTLTPAQEAAAYGQTVPDPAEANKRFKTKESSLLRPAAEASKKAQVREYAEKRPFLGEGTRQKILSQEDRPLTIDEVRELLNKSK